MRGEAKFWAHVRPFFHALGHVSRIESHFTSTGVPDLEVCCGNGNQWWVELKFCDNMKKGVIMRPAQKRWHTQRSRAGGKSVVLTRFNIIQGTFIYTLHWGDVAAALPTEPEEWFHETLYTWNDSIDFDELKDFFYETKQR